MSFDRPDFDDRTSAEHNPFAAPDTTGELPATGNPFNNRVYGGIGRLGYFGYSLLVGFLIGLLAQAFPELQVIAVLLNLGAAIIIVSNRLVNMGFSGWWALGIFVPILNLLVGLRCMACPEGYADHRTLDTAGKVIVGLIVAAILFSVMLVVLFFSRL